MKKLAIGCAIVLVLFGVVASVATYYVFYKAKSYFSQFETFAKLDDQVKNTASFREPATGELTPDMVTRFAAVQESMQGKLGGRVDEMKKKQDEFQRLQNTEHRQATAREAFTVVTDVMSLVLEAKKAQVEALNQQHFSLEEYRWVRATVYGAAGMHIAQISMNGINDAMEKQKDNDAAPPLEAPASELPKETPAPTDPAKVHNEALVTPLIPKLKEWAVLAFFGL
jgi:hypothetical protein